MRYIKGALQQRLDAVLPAVADPTLSKVPELTSRSLLRCTPRSKVRTILGGYIGRVEANTANPAMRHKSKNLGFAISQILLEAQGRLHTCPKYISFWGGYIGSDGYTTDANGVA